MCCHPSFRAYTLAGIYLFISRPVTPSFPRYVLIERAKVERKRVLYCSPLSVIQVTPCHCMAFTRETPRFIKPDKSENLNYSNASLPPLTFPPVLFLLIPSRPLLNSPLLLIPLLLPLFLLIVFSSSSFSLRHRSMPCSKVAL